MRDALAPNVLHETSNWPLGPTLVLMASVGSLVAMLPCKPQLVLAILLGQVKVLMELMEPLVVLGFKRPRLQQEMASLNLVLVRSLGKAMASLVLMELLVVLGSEHLQPQRVKASLSLVLVQSLAMVMASLELVASKALALKVALVAHSEVGNPCRVEVLEVPYLAVVLKAAAAVGSPCLEVVLEAATVGSPYLEEVPEVPCLEVVPEVPCREDNPSSHLGCIVVAGAVVVVRTGRMEVACIGVAAAGVVGPGEASAGVAFLVEDLEVACLVAEVAGRTAVVESAAEVAAEVAAEEAAGVAAEVAAVAAASAAASWPSNP